jgi:hypothetical protein
MNSSVRRIGRVVVLMIWVLAWACVGFESAISVFAFSYGLDGVIGKRFLVTNEREVRGGRAAALGIAWVLWGSAVLLLALLKRNPHIHDSTFLAPTAWATFFIMWCLGLLWSTPIKQEPGRIRLPATGGAREP